MRLLLDLDGFKEVNDRHGHHAGDLLLQQASQALRGRLRETDFLARLGGDAFAVILPHADEATARAVGRQLLDALRQLKPAALSASCGLASYDRDSHDVETILARADRAMYQAKASGHGRVAVAGYPTTRPHR